MFSVSILQKSSSLVNLSEVELLYDHLLTVVYGDYYYYCHIASNRKDFDIELSFQKMTKKGLMSVRVLVKGLGSGRLVIIDVCVSILVLLFLGKLCLISVQLGLNSPKYFLHS